MLRFFALFPILILLTLQTAAKAQLLNERFDFDPDIEYSSDITSPEEFLGYPLGQEYTHHHQLGDYLKNLAAESDRVTVITYGETYEGRDLWLAFITSEENHARLDEIRENNLLLSDPEADHSAVIEDNPAIVWLSYGVHGNEASSAESALQTAYRLAAGEDDETSLLRSDAVTIIDPVLNPDGRERYVTWYKSSQANVLNTDASDLEHDEIWPGGRTNHYWFDLNRDWTWLVHPESRGRIAQYNEWMPQVHLDIHEQGFNDNYFTMPGTTPRNLQLPDDYEEWSNQFGLGVIEEFDEHNISYATSEAFDFFYPGYGSSYPSLMGAIGMLAEQGGHSRGGRAVETEDGYVLTLQQRIFDHYKNSISTVRTAVSSREQLLTYYRDALNPEASKVATEVYVLPDNQTDHTYEVIDMLLKHDITVERADADFTLRNGTDYRSGISTNRSLSAGDFIIKKDQPKHLFITTLFEPEMAIEDSVMYDMSVWSVPLAYNLDAYYSDSVPSVSATPLVEAPARRSGVVNASATYAFVIDWEQPGAPKALAKLWEKGYNVRSAEKLFTKGGLSFSRGTLIILAGRNFEKRSQLSDDMREIAQEAGVIIHGFNTGRMDSGMDLASRSSSVLNQPKTALIVDRPFNSYTAGQIWFQFDRNVEYGISRLRSWRLSSLDLSEYDVLILPGYYGGAAPLDEPDMNALKDWVQAGGTLVATEQSAFALTDNRSEFTSLEMVVADEDSSDETTDPAAFTPYEARTDSSGLRRIPGAAFHSHLDISNPLAFGVKEQIYSLTYTTDQLKPSSSYQVVGYYDSDASNLLASGYASQENLEKAAGNVFAAVAPMGRGNVVLLTDNTQYRMFWRGPERLLINAVMLVGAM